MALRRRREERSHELFPGFTDVYEIGVGSLATVYRAREIGTSRLVALKLLNVRDASPRAIESFERESVALGALSSHPNIVTLYRTFRTPDGRPVLVLELCSRRGRRPAARRRRAAGPGRRRASASRSPARSRPRTAAASCTATSSRRTSWSPSSASRRSPTSASRCCSPRRRRPPGCSTSPRCTRRRNCSRARGTSAATDVYELASSLYQLIAGQSAFRAYEGESPASVILRILRDPVRPLSGPDVPVQLSDLLIRAMSKDMDNRPPTAAEFAAELAEVEIAQGWPRTQFLIRDPAAARSARRSPGCRTRCRAACRPRSAPCGRRWPASPLPPNRPRRPPRPRRPSRRRCAARAAAPRRPAPTPPPAPMLRRPAGTERRRRSPSRDPHGPERRPTEPDRSPAEPDRCRTPAPIPTEPRADRPTRRTRRPEPAPADADVPDAGRRHRRRTPSRLRRRRSSAPSRSRRRSAGGPESADTVTSRRELGAGVDRGAGDARAGAERRRADRAVQPLPTPPAAELAAAGRPPPPAPSRPRRPAGTPPVGPPRRPRRRPAVEQPEPGAPLRPGAAAGVAGREAPRRRPRRRPSAVRPEPQPPSSRRRRRRHRPRQRRPASRSGRRRRRRPRRRRRAAVRRRPVDRPDVAAPEVTVRAGTARLSVDDQQLTILRTVPQGAAAVVAGQPVRAALPDRRPERPAPGVLLAITPTGAVELPATKRPPGSCATCTRCWTPTACARGRAPTAERSAVAAPPAVARAAAAAPVALVAVAAAPSAASAAHDARPGRGRTPLRWW